MENKYVGFCTACGAGFEENQSFCEKCGQKIEKRTEYKVENIAETGTGSTMVQTTIRYEVNNNKIRNIIIAIVAVIACFGIGAFAINEINKTRAEEAKEEYLEDAEEFLELVMEAGINLEDISDTVVQYWHDCIWEDMYYEDIDIAVDTALSDMWIEVDNAEEHNEELNALFKKVKKVPDNLSEDDEEELEEICDAIKTLYNTYKGFYTHATVPTGSYDSYSEDNGDIKDEFLDAYHELESLLD